MSDELKNEIVKKTGKSWTYISGQFSGYRKRFDITPEEVGVTRFIGAGENKHVVLPKITLSNFTFNPDISIILSKIDEKKL